MIMALGFLNTNVKCRLPMLLHILLVLGNPNSQHSEVTTSSYNNWKNIFQIGIFLLKVIVIC